jgi:hypothetical protein
MINANNFIWKKIKRGHLGDQGIGEGIILNGFKKKG